MRLRYPRRDIAANQSCRNTRGSEGLSEAIEDHALERVPLDQRKSGWSLAWSSTGLVTTLIQITIGSYVAAVAGVGLGILAGVLVCIFGATLGWLVGYIACSTGMSSTVTGRFYGFGSRGSLIASAILGFEILGFLALENALLYNGTIFALGWEPSLENALLIYGVLTIAWILLTTFGINLVIRVSSILVVVFFALLLFMVWEVGFASGTPIKETLTHGPLLPGFDGTWDRFSTALVALAGSAGALALNDADYARYARSARDVGVLAIAGAVAIDILMVVSGIIVIYGAIPIVADYLVQTGRATSDGAAGVANTLAQANTGAFFIVVSSIVGFILMYAAQAKAQVLNTYSGSLALTNLFDAVFRWRPGRFFMVVLGNLIGLAMVAGGILGALQAWLGALGILATSFCGIMIADYYMVRQRSADPDHSSVDSVNWAGVCSIILASVVSFILQQYGIFALGFLLSLFISIVSYTVLRLWVLKPGTLTKRVSTGLTGEEPLA